MNHIRRERLKELAGPSIEGKVEPSGILSAEESAHLRKCTQCADLLLEAVQAGVGRTLSEKNPPVKLLQGC